MAETLSGLLVPERVRIPLTSADKESILAELVELAVGSRGLEDLRAEVLEAVRDRERVLSTGIGEGIAVPHAKCNGLDDMIAAAGVSREPVEFGALDGEPVQLFFLLVGPDAAAGSQVRALSRISRLTRDKATRARLLAAGDADRFLHAIGEAELTL